MKYRLVNKSITDITSDEDFAEHKWVLKTNSPLAIKRYVADHKLDVENVSVMTVVVGKRLTVYSYKSFKWID